MAKKKKRKVNYTRVALLSIIVILVIILCLGLVLIGINMMKKEPEKVVKKEKVKIVDTQKEDVQDDLDEEIQNRLDAYMELNPDMSKEEALKRVKMNLDFEPYEVYEINEDLDSITMLVNKYNGLPQDYVPEDLIGVTSSGENGIVQMREEAAEAFEELIVGAADQGLIIEACSAFRDYNYQYNLYNNGLASGGQEYADTWWTRPGFSEHQTGLSADVRLDKNYSDLDAARYSQNYDWFLEHLHDYGFILRYPDDKQEYTLISPESWHIRYVGRELANELYEKNLSLDEWYGLK